MLERTKKFCDAFLDTGLPGFDLMVCQGGKCILRHQGGYRDFEKKIPMDGTERYNIYSCTKGFTCVAALQLWEQGKFSLEDPLSAYLPEFETMQVRTEEGLKPAENPILIKHLFEMTAGFSYEVNEHIQRCVRDTNGRCPTREMMKYLAREPLQFEPGKYWKYSLCHDVLAAVVEVVSGEKFEDYVQKHIFDPLGMKNSTMMLPEAELGSIAPQYAFKNGFAENIGVHIFPYKFGSEYASGGAGAISTVEDYMKFIEGLRTFKLLRPETVRLMAIDRLNESQRSTYTKRAGHGYGLGVRCPKEGGKQTDFGWGGAAGAYWAIDPAMELSIYLGSHCRHSPASARTLLGWFIKADLLDDTEDLAAIAAELKDLVGYSLTY